MERSNEGDRPVWLADEDLERRPGLAYTRWLYKSGRDGTEDRGGTGTTSTSVCHHGVDLSSV